MIRALIQHGLKTWVTFYLVQEPVVQHRRSWSQSAPTSGLSAPDLSCSPLMRGMQTSATPSVPSQVIPASSPGKQIQNPTPGNTGTKSGTTNTGTIPTSNAAQQRQNQQTNLTVGKTQAATAAAQYNVSQSNYNRISVSTMGKVGGA